MKTLTIPIGENFTIPARIGAVGYEGDIYASQLVFTGAAADMQYKLDVMHSQTGEKNVIDLTNTDGTLSVVFDSAISIPCGNYKCQLRTVGDVVIHSNKSSISINDSINAIDAFANVNPSEMAQIEARMTALKNAAEAAESGALSAAAQTGKDAEQTAADREATSTDAKSTAEDREAVESEKTAIDKIVSDFNETVVIATQNITDAGTTQLTAIVTKANEALSAIANLASSSQTDITSTAETATQTITDALNAAISTLNEKVAAAAGSAETAKTAADNAESSRKQALQNADDAAGSQLAAANSALAAAGSAEASAQHEQTAAQHDILLATTLTDAQKETARENIGAASQADVTELNKALSNDVANALKKTVSGKVISVDDVSPIQHELKWTQYGQCTQNGTPTPDAPIPITAPNAGATIGNETDTTETLVVTDTEGNPVPMFGMYGYVDTVDSNGNHSAIIGKYEFTGKEFFNRPWGDLVFSTSSILSVPQIADNNFVGVMSNEYPCVSYAGTPNSMWYFRGRTDYPYLAAIIYRDSNRGNVLFKNTDYTTLADFKAYLAARYAAGNPVTIYYVRAEPVTETVNINSVHSNAPTTTVMSDCETDMTYNRDIVKAYNELATAIVALGGTI